MPHILIVEDETIIRSALRRLLERNQYQVSEAGSVQEAQERYSIPTFDLIVSDLRLPGAPGTELIKLGEGTPVLIMTSYASLRSAVDSMKMGAVDYIAKPFKPAELLARVRARLRPKEEHSKGHLLVGGLEIDLAGHTVSRGGESISLTPLEFDLLANLAQQPGQVMTRESLLDNVWGYEKSVDSRLVNVHIQRLRSKIEQDPENPQIVLTVRGVGYKAVSDKSHR